MNNMKSKIDQQTDLLKLILQKMEIKSEDDDNDDISADKQKITNLWNSAFKNIRLRTSVLHQFNS